MTLHTNREESRNRRVVKKNKQILRCDCPYKTHNHAKRPTKEQNLNTHTETLINSIDTAFQSEKDMAKECT